MLEITRGTSKEEYQVKRRAMRIIRGAIFDSWFKYGNSGLMNKNQDESFTLSLHEAMSVIGDALRGTSRDSGWTAKSMADAFSNRDPFAVKTVVYLNLTANGGGRNV